MLTITDLGFTLAGRRLFDSTSARAPEKARIGLVGRNGTGKSTLFRLIEGDLTPDQGAIEIRRGARIGGVAQEAPATRESLLDIVLAADIERAALLAEAETAADAARIAEIQARLTDIEAHSAEARAASILHGLGFDAAAQARAAAEFSGGWRMRVALAAVLFARPDLLLLDEPTNYLDLEGAVWLESFLARYPATSITISHDRGLLNRAVNAILHLENAKLTFYQGPFDTFDRTRRARLEQQAAEASKQAATRAHLMSFVDRFRYKASKAKQAQSRLKMLERMQPIAVPGRESVAPFVFPAAGELPPPVVAMEGVSVGYDGRPILRGLDLRIDPDDRIALLGANGEGKSTLSKLIAGRLAPMEGRVTASSKLRVGYFAQHQLDELTPGENAIQHIHRLFPEEAPAKLRARLGAAGIGAEIAALEVERLSGGQKARLLMALMAAPKPQMLILDEPTNHLDMESREALAMGLNDYPGAVILVSHDPFLVEAVADRLWLVRGGRVTRFDGDMDDYRNLLLSERGGGVREAKVRKKAKQQEAEKPKRSAAERRTALAPLREAARIAEARVAKIEEMKAKIDKLLSDPTLYASADPKNFEALQKKRAEVVAGLAKAEAIWLDALAALEAEEERAA